MRKEKRLTDIGTQNKNCTQVCFIEEHKKPINLQNKKGLACSVAMTKYHKQKIK